MHVFIYVTHFFLGITSLKRLNCNIKTKKQQRDEIYLSAEVLQVFKTVTDEEKKTIKIRQMTI